jgi:hypothetical protein
MEEWERGMWHAKLVRQRKITKTDTFFPSLPPIFIVCFLLHTCSLLAHPPVPLPPLRSNFHLFTRFYAAASISFTHIFVDLSDGHSLFPLSPSLDLVRFLAHSLYGAHTAHCLPFT